VSKSKTPSELHWYEFLDSLPGKLFPVLTEINRAFIGSQSGPKESDVMLVCAIDYLAHHRNQVVGCDG